MKKSILITLLLITIAGASDIPYSIKNGTIVWKPVPNDIDKSIK